MAYSEDEIEIKFRLILEGLESGKSLRAVLREDDMPDSRTFYKWLDNDQNKITQYARACEKRTDSIFEEILDIADETHSDKKVLEDGREVIDNEVIQRSRLRVDARKWMLSKMNPKKYGDKLETDNKHSGTLEIVRRIKK